MSSSARKRAAASKSVSSSATNSMKRSLHAEEDSDTDDERLDDDDDDGGGMLSVDSDEEEHYDDEHNKSASKRRRSAISVSSAMRNPTLLLKQLQKSARREIDHSQVSSFDVLDIDEEQLTDEQKRRKQELLEKQEQMLASAAGDYEEHLADQEELEVERERERDREIAEAKRRRQEAAERRQLLARQAEELRLKRIERERAENLQKNREMMSKISPFLLDCYKKKRARKRVDRHDNGVYDDCDGDDELMDALEDSVDDNCNDSDAHLSSRSNQASSVIDEEQEFGGRSARTASTIDVGERVEPCSLWHTLQQLQTTPLVDANGNAHKVPHWLLHYALQRLRPELRQQVTESGQFDLAISRSNRCTCDNNARRLTFPGDQLPPGHRVTLPPTMRLKRQ